jgi:hypothetical protein
MAALVGHAAPHRCAVCSPNITSDYANRRAGAALRIINVHVVRAAGAVAPGATWPRASSLRRRARPCARSLRHAASVARGWCASLRSVCRHALARVLCTPTQHVRATRPRKGIARPLSSTARLNAARSSRSRFVVLVVAAKSGQQGGSRIASRTAPPWELESASWRSRSRASPSGRCPDTPCASC